MLKFVKDQLGVTSVDVEIDEDDGNAYLLVNGIAILYIDRDDKTIHRLVLDLDQWKLVGLKCDSYQYVASN